MELLYIWVEDYFVLKNVSFNFSNRFLVRDKIDIEKRTISLELLDREEFVQGFFPKGILSVAAIVGENGVGKSSLLSVINLINHRPELIGCSWLSLHFESKTKTPLLRGLLIGQKQKKWDFKYASDAKGNFNDIVLSDINFNKESNDHSIISIFYNPSFDLKDYRGSINDKDKGMSDVSTNFLIEDDWEKKNTDDFNVDQVTNHRFKNVYRQFALTQLDSSIKESLKIPDEIEIRFNKNREIDSNNLSHTANDILEFFRELGSNEAQLINDDILKARNKKNKDQFKLASLKKVKHWFLVNLLENYYSELTKWYDFQENRFNQKIRIEDINGGSFEESIQRFFDLQDFVKKKGYSIRDFIKDIFSVIDTNANIGRVVGGVINESFFNIPTSVAILVHQSNLKYLSLFKSKGMDKNSGFLDFNWRDLSNGEKAYLDLYSRLFYGYRQFENKVLNASVLFVIIDEGELGFHPQWQKEYISNLIKFLCKLSEGLPVQLIVTSHSPFVVSDLPKSNVILLNRDREGKTFVDKLKVREQTFAANIHEILSDSFFMKDGTMGDFAKEKIVKLVEQLDSVNRKNVDSFPKNQKVNIKKLIDFIGEPVIRERLRDMYEERFMQPREVVEERIRRLRNEIDDAEKQLDAL